MTEQLELPAEARRPIRNGQYTISGPRGHGKFRVKTQRAEPKTTFYAGRRIFEIGDSEARWGWTSIGVVDVDGMKVSFMPWQARNPKNKQYVTLIGLFNVLAAATASEVEVEGKRYTMQLVQTCSACNRKLTHPESISSGIGPECSNRGYSDRKGTERSVAVTA